MVNVLASGVAPAELAPFLGGAPLTPLRKESQDGSPKVRPIAVGEALRRLVSKCVTRHEAVRGRLGGVFLPDQVGVGVPDGATAVAMAVRTVASQHGDQGDWALLKVDFDTTWAIEGHRRL